MKTQPAREYRDTTVDVKLVLAALWTTMLFVFAYVDIFGFYRAAVLEAALDGTVGTTGLAVDQVFLTATVIYILIPSLMVIGSVRLPARMNRVANLVVSPLYAMSILASCIGESFAYYLIGSAVEILLLAVIARTAWTWPAPISPTVPSRPAVERLPATPRA